jgi:aminomuconate-semialdehyde/2-hydroxymuconate-6-semialdehyde dehydrogenase
MHRIEHFINGAMTPAVKDDWIDLIEPATGRRIGTVAAGTAADMDKAVKAAQGAAPRWAATSPAERARVLRAMADGIETRMDDFARAESIDTGKPITLALAVDIPRAVANLRWFADAAVDFLDRSSTDELFQTDRASFAVTHQPVGVIGAISPWNLPLYLLTWKLAPALAMGNAVVAKPSELTPTTAAMLCAVAHEAGLPPGVLNCVHGTGVDAGAALVEHPMVQAVTFTGGTQTGRLVNAACAAGRSFKKVSLELGGKNATVIFADADMDAAIDTAAAAAFANQGQICLCGERLLVEASILDRVLEGVVEKARSLRIGDPLEPSTEFGSLISVEHRTKVAEAVKAAVADGGQLCCGGRPPCDLPPRVSSGAFYEPTVLTGLDMDADFNRNEVFGPIVSLMPFEDEAEAIAMVNATDYGLSASVCTTDDARAQRMAQGIDVGTLWVNCWLVRDFRVPFGGMKHSGLGREGGDDALRFCSESKTVCTARGPTGGTEGAIPLSVPSMEADS